MSVRVVERLGWRRRGASSAIRADPGRMTPVDVWRLRAPNAICDVRGSAVPAEPGVIRGCWGRAGPRTA